MKNDTAQTLSVTGPKQTSKQTPEISKITQNAEPENAVDFILQHFPSKGDSNSNGTKDLSKQRIDALSSIKKGSPIESSHRNKDSESIEEDMQFDPELGSCYGYALLNVSVLFFFL